jgi:hypothetical protein
VHFTVLDRPLVDGLTARTPVPGVTRHLSTSPSYLTMLKITYSTTRLDEKDVRAEVNRLLV